MRFVSLAFILLIPMLSAGQEIPSARTTTNDDGPYHITFVAQALDFYGGLSERRAVMSSEFKWFTHQTPSLPQLGDAVTVAALKILGPDRLLLEKQTSAYLLIVREAFSDRRRVVEISNVNAGVTLFVLDYLKQKKADNIELQKRISYLQGCVLDFSCSGEGESAYVAHRPELPQPKPPEH